MRKVISLLVALMLLIGAASALAEESLTVVATTYPLYDMAKAVCGDLAQVVYAPEDAQAQAEGADILLCMGAEDDQWADALENVRVVKAVDGIELIEGDSDVLTVPVNCMICASYLADALNALDGDNNAAYQANLDEYVTAMADMDAHIRQSVTEGMKVRGADGSMAYFAREYNLVNDPEATDAAELNTFDRTADADAETPYVELMHQNLHALAGGED